MPLNVDFPSPKRLREQRRRQGESFPRFFLFLVDFPDEPVLKHYLEELRNSVGELFEKIYVYLSPNWIRHASDSVERLGKLPGLTVLRHVGEKQNGAHWKVGLQYALDQKADFVLVTQIGGDSDPGDLIGLIDAALFHHAKIAQCVDPPTKKPAAMDRLLDFLLHLDHGNYFFGPWLYCASVLKAAPFAVNTDAGHFPFHLLIQGKALSHPIFKVPRRDPIPSRNRPFGRTLNMIGSALHYRLHQLHIRRHGRWLVDYGEAYTFKRSPLSSHKQILRAVPPGVKVLDLGCSQGLLARELAKKGCWVAGVDRLGADQVVLPYDQYVQADLDDPKMKLPFERQFDVIILADVIEHLHARSSIMALVRRHLKEDGRLIISTGNIAIWFYRVSLLLGRFEYGPRGILDETHVRLFTRATFERLVQEAGFEILAQATTPLPFEIIFQSRTQNRVLITLERGYHALCRFWPELFAYQFLLHARIGRLESHEGQVISLDEKNRDAHNP